MIYKKFPAVKKYFDPSFWRMLSAVILVVALTAYGLRFFERAYSKNHPVASKSVKTVASRNLPR